MISVRKKRRKETRLQQYVTSRQTGQGITRLTFLSFKFHAAHDPGSLSVELGSIALAAAVAALLKQGHNNVQETQENGCLPQCPHNTRQCVSTSMPAKETAESVSWP